jgi:D-3-phosphoglycerate dehydrogenase / 2-oxoglutarate reductase
MSTIVIIDHGVVGDRAVERRVLESAGHEVLDTQALGLSVEQAFELAVEQDAVAILAGPILPLDRDHLERLDRCRAVVRYGVGLDNVDVDSAQQLGIAVGNVPEYGHEEISNHAIALLLALARKLPAFDAAVRRGGKDIPAPQSVRRLSASTLGLVGLGRIGRRVAEKARAFGLTVVAHDPYAKAEAGVELLELDELLARADILSLHVPLTPETRHMIGARELALLRPGAFVVNIGRGGLLDEDALVAALRRGRVAGAALDVTEIEPLPLDSPLLDAPNVILTPHVAWVSDVALEDLKRLTAEAALRLLAGPEPAGARTPEPVAGANSEPVGARRPDLVAG